MDTLPTRFTTMLNASHMDFGRGVSMVVRTCTEMLQDRGCVDVDAASDVGSIIRCITDVQPVLRGSGAGVSTFIFFVAEERVAVKSIRSIMEDHGGGMDAMLFVSTDGPTTFAKREAHAQWGSRVQFFKYRDLSVNITHHVLVPKHERYLGAREHKDENYPRILVTDPVCQYYNFVIGDLVRIERTHGCTQPFPYYRLVVAPPS